MKTTRKVVDKREKDIKKKLSAAILMLLVSCIMVVTSTYAWFTLSTAPEVTGIQTTIGGNGNLEIALAGTYTNEAGTTVNTWTNNAGVQTITNGGSATQQEKNITWGNLINVAEGYGVDKLNLLPSKLSYVEGSTTKLNNNLIEAPKYGSDGRVSELTKAVMSAVYDKDGDAFIASADQQYGLRALGISAAMTARQSGYIVALSGVSSNAESARTGTSLAMQANGGALGSIVVALAKADVANRDSVTFSDDQYDAVSKLLDDTLAATAYIETSILNAVRAYIASSEMQDTTTDGTDATKLTDAEYSLVIATLEGAKINDTYFTVDDSAKTVTYKYSLAGEDGASTNETITISNEAFYNMISKYKSINSTLTTAKSSLPQTKANHGSNEEGVTPPTYTWAELKGSVENLMNLGGKITVSGRTIDDMKAILNNMDVTEMLNILNNLVVELGEGSGVYYDISQLVGEIKASVKLDVTYGGISATGVNATIKSSATAPWLPAIASELNGKSPSSVGSDEANIISDRYAFALDLLFRTNAADSKLLLATQPRDRIYSDNTNAETMGAGSTMTFKKAVASFTEEQMVNLIENIKIVFVDDQLNVLATAGLDVGTDGENKNYTVDGEGSITADMRLFGADGNFLADGSAENSTNAQAICSLTQNQVKNVSVLVYLDGETITNSDVANAINSMTATMNLQFESSAELIPMEYSGLHHKPGTESGENTGAEQPSGDGE